jgi:hypothetical protein
MSPLCPISNPATIASDAAHLGHGRTAGSDRRLNPRLGHGELGVESADVAEQLLGQFLTFGLHLTAGTDRA